jgi:hypothetical protein
LIRRDAALVRDVVCRAAQLDAQGDTRLQAEIAGLEKKVQACTNRISDLMELAGQGTDEDRRQVRATIRAAQVQRSSLQAELTRRQRAADGSAERITPERVREILADFTGLLEDAAAGKLGTDAVYKASSLVRQLTGGRIWVHVQERPGRKRALVKAVFRPRLVRAVRDAAGASGPGDEQDPPEVEVWLRRPPRMDRFAAGVRRLYEEDGLAFRVIGERLGIGCAGAWQAYRRYYDMLGEPMPPRRPNTGRPRKSV